jgi:uncharacterized membrane protein YoaK (UPF0700 family)
MKNLGHHATRDLMMFCFVAGSADAAGFLGVGHVFTSNMTGNLVLLGIECGQAQWHPALKTLYVLMMFAIGVGVGSRLTRRFSDRAWDLLVRRLTMIEAGLLILFAVFWALATEERRLVHFYDLIPFLAVAMGIQSAAMNRLTIAGVTNTAMTGTLTNLMVGLEGVLFNASGQEPDVRQRAKKQMFTIVLYCGGAAANGWLMLHASWAIGFVPAIFVTWIMLSHLGNKAE